MSDASWIRVSERPFLRTVEDWCLQVTRHGRWYLTDFLTPREQFIANSIGRKHGLVTASFGGYEGAERQRMLLMPDEWYPVSNDFDVVCLRIEVDDGELRHKDMLGSVLGLGIHRKTLGDMAIMERRQGYMFVTEAMARFLKEELRQVGRAPVSVSVATETLVIPPPQYEDKQIFVASLRLDAVVAGACNLSRSKAQELVERGHVSLNFAEATVKDDVAIGDSLSVRGFGRVKVVDTLGTTKSDRTRVHVGILRSNS